MSGGEGGGGYLYTFVLVHIKVNSMTSNDLYIGKKYNVIVLLNNKIHVSIKYTLNIQMDYL